MTGTVAVSAREPRSSAPLVSVIIPCYNSSGHLAHCLAAIADAGLKNAEIFVVDDASTEDPEPVVRSCGFPIELMRMPRRSGPAAARNAGAHKASGDILIFIDADVCVHSDTFERITQCFSENPSLGALMGSYDDNPSERGFHSRFRNLLHSYTHQTARREACTFWTGCGAIYRDVFLRHRGFDPTPGRIDDVEFGRRLTAGGVRIEMHSEIKVQHLKRWTPLSWIATDFRLRGIPWTLLIFRDRAMPNVLNLDYRNRASVAFVCAALAAAIAGIAFPKLLWVPLLLVAVVLWLNRRCYSYFKRHGGLFFAIGAAFAHLLHLLVCGASFVAGAALFLTSSRRQAGATRALEHAAD